MTRTNREMVQIFFVLFFFSDLLLFNRIFVFWSCCSSCFR
ncbi:unnamed protein product [Brassica rapa]|uniref:Uncharacterized protein n=1 Tax=Brassica campestris TaxID=3711 RepID=A0A8D9DK91_BRACM|nr:unnamed protein product [Brassica rapa]